MNIRLWLVVVMIGMGMNLLSQPYPSSRKNLLQLIKEGNEQNDLKTYSLLACNEDSLFYIHDTLFFYDNASYFDEVVNCCEFLEWEFLSNNVIRQQEPLTCLEPSNVLLSSMRYYKYKVTKRKKHIFIDIMLDKKLLTSYLVRNIEYIELPNEERCRAITLIRHKDEIIPLQAESNKVILTDRADSNRIVLPDQAGSNKNVLPDKAKRRKKVLPNPADSSKVIPPDQADSSKTDLPDQPEVDNKDLQEQLENNKDSLHDQSEGNKNSLHEELKGNKDSLLNQSEGDKNDLPEQPRKKNKKRVRIKYDPL